MQNVYFKSRIFLRVSNLQIYYQKCLFAQIKLNNTFRTQYTTLSSNFYIKNEKSQNEGKRKIVISGNYSDLQKKKRPLNSKSFHFKFY